MRAPGDAAPRPGAASRLRAPLPARLRPLPASLLVAATVAGLVAAPLAAQGVLEGGRAVVDVTDPDRIRVALEYDLRGSDADAFVPFEGLAFRPARIAELGMTRDGAPVPVELVEGAGRRLTASLPLEGAGGAGGTVRVRVTYDVVEGATGDDPWRLRIPVMAPGWAATEALPGTFVAEIRTPVGWTLYEPFPSGLLAAEPEEGAGGERHLLDLPAVPALLSFRATTGTPRLGGMIQLLDGLVVVILGVLVVAGWLHFRSPA